MNRTEIKSALEIQGIKLADIGRALKVNPSTISAVISRRHPGKRVALAICKLLNKTPGEVFPDQPQYHPDYNPEQKSEAHIDEIRQRLAS